MIALVHRHRFGNYALMMGSFPVHAVVEAPI